MRLFKSREDSLRFGLSLFLIVGAVLGSLFCNRMSLEMKQELQLVEQNMVTATVWNTADLWELFVRILPKRLWMLVLMLLISSTSISALLLMAAAGWFGFSVSVMICSLTMEAGIFGICKFFLLNFPQCMVYVPVIYIVLWWMPSKRKRLTILSVAVLVLLVLLGAAVESFLNPWILRLW